MRHTKILDRFAKSASGRTKYLSIYIIYSEMSLCVRKHKQEQANELIQIEFKLREKEVY